MVERQSEIKKKNKHERISYCKVKNEQNTDCCKKKRKK